MAFAAGGYQVQCCGDINHFNEETRTRVSEAVPAEGQMGEIELEGLGVTPRPALQGLSLCSCAVCTIYCVFFFKHVVGTVNHVFSDGRPLCIYLSARLRISLLCLKISA